MIHLTAIYECRIFIIRYKNNNKKKRRWNKKKEDKNLSSNLHKAYNTTALPSGISNKNHRGMNEDLSLYEKGNPFFQKLGR